MRATRRCARAQAHLGIRLTVDAPRKPSSAPEGVYTSGDFPFPFRQRLTRSRRSMIFAVLADVRGNVAPRLRIAATCGIANVTIKQPFRIEWLRADYHVTFEIESVK